ncbi:hypothetical protein PCANC_19494 [Puccinia coronata f. sp. avenae]|uniref:Uncharacterized protein n=1 Tax=Puccinia coronata f. sp. avenae TaxID=200324 RepID=A0A2N5SFU5_9BASI|nr:hypothetical protein PCANC_19494 [Puccinia coronata f. sp. avenae]
MFKLLIAANCLVNGYISITLIFGVPGALARENTRAQVHPTARKAGSDGHIQVYIGCGHPIQTLAQGHQANLLAKLVPLPVQQYQSGKEIDLLTKLVSTSSPAGTGTRQVQFDDIRRAGAANVPAIIQVVGRAVSHQKVSTWLGRVPSRLSIVGVTLLVPRPAKPDNLTSYLHRQQIDAGDLLGMRALCTSLVRRSTSLPGWYMYQPGEEVNLLAGLSISNGAAIAQPGANFGGPQGVVVLQRSRDRSCQQWRGWTNPAFGCYLWQLCPPGIHPRHQLTVHKLDKCDTLVTLWDICLQPTKARPIHPPTVGDALS